MSKEELIGLLFPDGAFMYNDDIDWDLLTSDDYYRITARTTFRELEDLAEKVDITEIIDHLLTI